MLSHLKQQWRNYHHIFLLPLPTLTVRLLLTLNHCSDFAMTQQCHPWTSPPCPIPHFRPLPFLGASFISLPWPHVSWVRHLQITHSSFPLSSFTYKLNLTLQPNHLHPPSCGLRSRQTARSVTSTKLISQISQTSAFSVASEMTDQTLIKRKITLEVSAMI